MRKSQKSFVWLTILLMVFNLLPINALADTSNVYGLLDMDGTATATQEIQNAIDNNMADPFVAVTNVTVSPSGSAIPTGDWFRYTVYYSLKPSPVYYPDPESPTTAPTYTQYDQVVFTLTPDTDIELTGAGIVGLGNGSYTYTLLDQNVSSGGISGNFEVTARMTNNGTAANLSDYNALGIAAVADVTAVDTGSTMVFHQVPVSNNSSATQNSAGATWRVLKTAAAGEPVADTQSNQVTVTYFLEVGKTDNDGELVKTAANYNVTGALAFSAFSLSDTPAPFIDIAEQSVAPLGWTVTPLDASGNSLTAQAVSGSGATASISYYNTLAATETAGGVTISGSQTDPIYLPMYTRYRVEVIYPLDPLIAPYEEPDRLFTLSNAAALAYTLVGETAQTEESSAQIAYAQQTDPGYIAVYQYLHFDGENKEYDAFYHAFFPGAGYAVFHAADFDTETGTPTGTAVTSFAITDHSQTTGALKPGDYIVVQTDAPADQNTSTSLPLVDANGVSIQQNWQPVTVVSSATPAAVRFYNKVQGQGLLKLKKTRTNGTAFANVTFTLNPVSGTGVYTGVTNAQGIAYILAPAGDYTLVETPPSGYLKAADQPITLTAGETLDITGTPIINVANTASLTLTKYAVLYQRPDRAYADEEKTLINAVSGVNTADFSFTLAYSTDPDFPTGDTTTQIITLDPAQASATLSNLPRTAEDGETFFWYRLTENTPGDAAFNRDAYSYGWQYTESASQACDFYDQLHSALTFYKAKWDVKPTSLGYTETAGQGITFTLYRQNADSSFTQVGDSLTTGSDGKATTPYLPIQDENGAIAYYLAETVPVGYTVTYPANASITVGEDTLSAWGPLTLNAAKTTDLSAQKIINSQNLGQILLQKRQAPNKTTNLAGAKFAVYYFEPDDAQTRHYVSGSDLSPFTTTTGGVLVNSLPIGYTYYIEETEAPAGYRLDATPNPLTVAVSTPLQTGTYIFYDNKKPTLAVRKTMLDPTTGAATNFSGTFSFALYRWTGTEMAWVADFANVTATNASSVTTAALVVEDNGTDYFVKETGYPASVIPPEVINNTAVGQLWDGAFYYQVPALANNGAVTLTLQNRLNKGSLTLNKTDLKTGNALAGATFHISVSDPDAAAQSLLALQGFTQNAQDETLFEITVALGEAATATLTGLPVFNANGTQLRYAVVETEAPAGYRLPDNNAPRVFTVAQQANYTAATTYQNPPSATLTALKLYYKEWENLNNPLLYPLPGATFALYLLEEGTLRYVNTDQTPTVVTNAAGQAQFSDLDGTKAYVVVEMAPPTGYELPVGKSGLTDYAALVGMPIADVLSAYNAATYDLMDAENNAYLVAKEQALQNSKPYAQFRITKTDGEDQTLLDHAKFTLYYCTDAILKEYAQTYTGAALFSAIQSAGHMQHDSYVYESGTGLTANGNAAQGVFQTKALEYGAAYWFMETDAPHGYQIDTGSNPFGPFTFDGAYGTQYVHSGLTEATFANTPQGGGGTGGEITVRYFQIHLNKELRDEQGTYLKNLAGVTFELWLADDDYQPQQLLTQFTTGLDTAVNDYASVAGRGVSETLEFSRLYSLYSSWVTRTDEPEGATYRYQYAANFVLREKLYPANVTPQNVLYPLTINTADSSVLIIEDHTYDKTAEGNHSLQNILQVKSPVRIRKMGYTVPLSGESTLTPLEGVLIGVFADASCTQLVDSAATDALGYAKYTLEPNTNFWYREITAPDGYDLNPTIFSFLTGGYGSDVMTLQIEDPAYRVLNLIKQNMDGTQVGDVQLKIVRADDDGSIVDTNGNAFPAGADTLTTLGEAPVTIQLPYSINGDYSVVELSIQGESLTSADQRNFTLANQYAGTLPIRFSEAEAEKNITLINPDKAHFTLHKLDDSGAPMEGVSFTAYFKSFTLADVNPAVTTTVNSGWQNLGTWVTDANGQIEKPALTAGWYKLVETLPSGYVDNGAASLVTVIKMTAKGIGQSTTEPITLQVSNTRLGYLTISKAFSGDLLEQVPQSVVFYLFTDALCQTPASPSSITVPLTGGVGSIQTALNPGTYYLTESSGAWYGKYSLDGAAEQWVNGAMQITITSDDTAANPVTLNVTNKPATARIAFHKIDDLGANVLGAKFAIYYTSGGEDYYYHEATRTFTTQIEGRTLWTTDAQGLATATFTLPFDRLLADEQDDQYFLKEVEAPAELEFAADRAFSVNQNTNTLDITAEPLVDVGGLYIDLTKYGRTQEHATAADTLPGAEFTLYIWNGTSATLQYALTTDAEGNLQFPNLKRLTGNQAYALVETATPEGFVPELTAVFVDDQPISPLSVTIGGQQRKLFVITQNQTVTVKAYNIPTGKIAVLKYNYLEPTSSATIDVPHYAIFSVKQVDDQGTVLETVHNNVIVTRYEAADPDTLAGGIAKDSATGLYKDANGWYYASFIVEGLAPGRYLIHEEQQAEHFYYTPNSVETDPWYPTRTVEVDDDGGVTVCMFTNIPKPEAPKISISKTVTAINDDAAATLLPSLQSGWQKLTYQIADFARATDGQPIQLPVDWLDLSDHELAFNDRLGDPVTGVEHYTRSVTVGKAFYEATVLNPNPTREILYASVYGVRADASETLVSTRNVTDASQKVSFPENTYVGFRIRYGTNNDGSANAGLKAGFTAEPVTAEMLFRQPNDATVTPAMTIENRAAVQLKYNLGGIDSVSSGWTVDVAEAAVAPEPTLPRVTISKTSDKQSVKPQDQIIYTVEVKNVSTDSAGLVDPVVIDHIPDQLEYKLSDVTWATLPAGITADAPVTNGEYLYVKFHGTLEPGASIKVYVKAVVRTAAQAISAFTNTAYVTSAHLVNQNVENPTGTSFTDTAGNLPSAASGIPGSLIQAEASTYLTLLAQTENTLTFNNQVTLYKMASANVTGMDQYRGSEGYAIASTNDGSDANIRYQLVVRNDGQAAIENLRVIDKLPLIGDRQIASNTVRDSRWPVTLLGVTDCTVADYTVYTTDVTEVSGGGTSNYINAITTGDITDWTTSTAAYATAQCLRIDFGSSVRLAPGESITVTIDCKAPTAQQATDGSALDSNYYFFWLANNTAAAASNLVGDSVRSVVYSARASTMLNPAPVSLGNRVWVDRNANGLQDIAQGEDIDDPATVFSIEPSLTIPNNLRLTLRTYVGSDVSYTLESTALDANGFYAFTSLSPGRIKTSSQSVAYDAAGNIYNNALFGVRPTSYQVLVSGIPAGYLVGSAYANNNGVYAPNYEHNTLAERANDSNIQLRSGSYASERFYLRINEDNPTVDVGLIRYRNLSITKQGNDGALLDGATFAIYGPFTDAALLSAIDLDGVTPVGVITSQSGVATFTSTSNSSFMNYYSNYIVVETDSGANWYHADQLTATGDAVAAADGYGAVSGGGIGNNNFFVLTARSDEDTGYIDEVTVINRYEASGILQVTGTKEMTGGLLSAGDFTFEMSSTDDPDFTTLTATNDADGRFAFAAYAYDFDDAGHTYHYTIAERNDGVRGVTYDTRVYTLAVTVYNLGGGVLEIQKQLQDQQGTAQESIVFQNTSKGSLRISKVLAGNAAIDTDAFAFTVTLTDPQNQPLSGTYQCVHSGDTAMTTLTLDPGGQADVTLRGGETLTISGLLTGTGYAVSEADSLMNGYTTTATGDTGSIDNDENVSEVVFTNTRNVGNLTVAKTLTGTAPDATKAFGFEVTLANGTMPVDGTYACEATGGKAQSAITFTGGKAALTLLGGQSLTILGIYAGTAYTVTEADESADAYVPTPLSRVLSGTIAIATAEETSTVAAFSNHRDATTLTVRKTLAGNAADTNKAFVMTITLSGSGNVQVDRTYPCESGSAVSSVTFTNGLATVSLKGGQWITITDIPVGTTYHITEADYTADGYLTTYLPDADPHTLTGAGSTVTVVNTRNTYGALVVSKSVAGAAVDLNKAFTFGLALRRSDTLSIDGVYVCERTNSVTGNITTETLTITGGEGSLTLKADESLAIPGILTGTAYTLTEADYRAEGYFPTPSSGIRTGVITDVNRSYAAPFINTRGAGRLVISKTVAGNAADRDQYFAFEVRFSRNDGIAVDGIYEAELKDNGASSSTSVTVRSGVARVMLKHGQSMTIKAILRDTTYKVTEDSYAGEGYDTIPASRQYSGTLLRDEQTAYASFTNVRNTGSLAISKTLAGNGASATFAFRFRVTLARTDSIPVNQTYICEVTSGASVSRQTITFTAGNASFTLLGGQRMTIYGIPTSTRYTVSEDSYSAEGYTTQASGTSGIIGTGQSSAGFTNTRWSGTLTVRKTLAGNAAEAERVFNFDITLLDSAGLPVNGTVAATGALRSVTFKTGKAAIGLKGGQSATIQNLRSGWTYTVVETEANTDGYVTTASGASGVIPYGGGTSALYTNERNIAQAYRRITVTKTWADENDKNGMRPGTISIYLFSGDVIIDVKEISAADGWTCLFENLPVFSGNGDTIQYRIVEGAIAKYYAQYTEGLESVSILNTYTPEVFKSRNGSTTIIIMDLAIPLGGNINMNQGDAIN